MSEHHHREMLSLNISTFPCPSWYYLSHGGHSGSVVSRRWATDTCANYEDDCECHGWLCVTWLVMFDRPWRARWHRSRGCPGSSTAPTRRTWRCPGRGRRASPRHRPCSVWGPPPPAYPGWGSPPGLQCSPSPRSGSADSSWWRSSRSSCRATWTSWPGPCRPEWGDLWDEQDITFPMFRK